MQCQRNNTCDIGNFWREGEILLSFITGSLFFCEVLCIMVFYIWTEFQSHRLKMDSADPFSVAF